MEAQYDHATETLANTRSLIENPEIDIDTLLWAIARHGVAVWQIGQHQVEWDWFCTLSHKAAWGDVFYKAEHVPTLTEAIRDAAQEWSKTR